MSEGLLPEGLSIVKRKVFLDEIHPTPALISTCINCGRSFLESPYNNEFSHKLPLIFTDGACFNNGQDNARAGYGVVIGNKAPDRYSFAWSGYDKRTNQKAELAGVKNGLELGFHVAMRQRRADNCPALSYENFVIATDSEYAVKGITEWMPMWNANRFRTSNGRAPVNEDEFREIDEILTHYEGLGHSVGLWHIPRAFNTKANELAREGASRDRGLRRYGSWGFIY